MKLFEVYRRSSQGFGRDRIEMDGDLAGHVDFELGTHASQRPCRWLHIVESDLHRSL